MFGVKRDLFAVLCVVGWPSGLRRQFQALVSSEAWVRIPLQSVFCEHFANRKPETPTTWGSLGGNVLARGLYFLRVWDFGVENFFFCVDEEKKVPRLGVAPRFSRPQREVIAPILSRREDGW